MLPTYDGSYSSYSLSFSPYDFPLPPEQKGTTALPTLERVPDCAFDLQVMDPSTYRPYVLSDKTTHTNAVGLG